MIHALVLAALASAARSRCESYADVAFGMSDADAASFERRGRKAKRRPVLQPFDRGEATHDLALAGVARFRLGQCASGRADLEQAFDVSRTLEPRDFVEASTSFSNGTYDAAFDAYLRALRSTIDAGRVEPASSGEPLWARLLPKALAQARAEKYEAARATLAAYRQGADDEPVAAVPYYLALVDYARGDVASSQREFFLAIDVGNGSSVHGGWFGYENEALDAMRCFVRVDRSGSIRSLRSGCSAPDRSARPSACR